MIVRVSAEAKADLARIADFIARDDPRRAISFIDELDAKCQSLGDFPNRFRWSSVTRNWLSATELTAIT